jgi:hypothetical protein
VKRRLHPAAGRRGGGGRPQAAAETAETAERVTGRAGEADRGARFPKRAQANGEWRVAGANGGGWDGAAAGQALPTE